MSSELMTADEVAERLRVPRTWVYRAAREGDLPSVRCGRYRRFDEGDVERWISRQKGTRANQTTFAYDDLGRVTQIDQPLAKRTSFSYDPAGNLATRTTAAGTLAMSYDAADQLTQIAKDAQILRSFGYDPIGRLTRATDAQNKSIALTYDADDRLTAISNGRGQTVTRGYDSRANLTAQTDGRGTLSYGYDRLNRMTQLTDPQNQMLGFAYDPEANLTTTNLPNGVVTTNAYDADGRMTETKSIKDAATLEWLRYAYDAAGNRVTQTDRDGAQTTYTHDALNRLSEWDPPSGLPIEPPPGLPGLPENPTGAPIAYAYDKAGNRTSAGSRTYAYDALNRLQSSSDGTTYTYDDAGRMTQRQDGLTTTTYAWNALDELNSVTDSSGTTSFSYDALGRRSERTRADATETAHYGDLTDLPILDTNATGIVRSFVAGPAGLVEERTGTATTYPLADAHGDITALTNQAGGVASRNTYDPWGARLSGTARQMGFLGAQQRRTDPTHGLLQMGVRQYEPGLGRFMSEDPLLGRMGLGQSVNRQGYAWNAPLRLYDLDGRAACGDASDFWTENNALIFDEVFGVLATGCEAVLEDQSLITDQAEAWTQSDSPLAPVLGPTAGGLDMIFNPSRGRFYVSQADPFLQDALNFSLSEALTNTAVTLTDYGLCRAARGPAGRVGAGRALLAICLLGDGVTAAGVGTDIADEDDSLWTDHLFHGQ